MASGTGQHADGEPLKVRVLPLLDVALIDGLKLIQTSEGPKLLYSTQVCRSPLKGLNDCQMEVHAVSVSDPSHAILVASLPRLLPPPPRWDARAVGANGYELVFEEAGGALYSVQLRDASGTLSSPSSAHPFESFTAPRFVRTDASEATVEVTAVLDQRTAVFLPASKGGTPGNYLALTAASDAVVGRTNNGYWMVAKTEMGGIQSFGVLPGRLFSSRFSVPGAAPTASPLPFPGFLAFELDALSLGGDVVVFATGKPAALLTASRASRPIRLEADDRSWLSAMSRPTVCAGAGRIHVAAIANPGTAEAKVLYGDFPIGALQQP